MVELCFEVYDWRSLERRQYLFALWSAVECKHNAHAMSVSVCLLLRWEGKEICFARFTVVTSMLLSLSTS